ncbi:MAG: cell division protein FtsQ/DivIB [Eubacteriaceae bacterium]
MKKADKHSGKNNNGTFHGDGFELWPEPEKPLGKKSWKESSLEPEESKSYDRGDNSDQRKKVSFEENLGDEIGIWPELEDIMEKKNAPKMREKVSETAQEKKELNENKRIEKNTISQKVPEFDLWFEDEKDESENEKSNIKKENPFKEKKPKKRWFFPNQKKKKEKETKKPVKQAEPKMTKEEERELRRKQRRINKRKRIIRTLISFVVILGIALSLAYFAYTAVQQGFFNIASIEVVGNEIIDAQSVMEASEIQIGESIFFADLNKAHYKINALVDLEKLEITKVMPNKILINMTESSPLCAINYDGKITYMTDDGILIENGDYLRKTDIPVVFGAESVNLSEIGKKVIIEPAWRFETVKNILEDLKKHGNLSKISEVRMTTDNTYELVTKNGTVLVVWDYNNFLENGNYIQNVLDQNTSNLVINLTAGTKPVVKPR